MNAICYSLFGYSEQYENCFSFKAYMRGIGVNLRMAEVLYPGWRVVVMIDFESMNSQYGKYFESLAKDLKAHVIVFDKSELCRMMLQRLRPIFELKASGDHMYDRIICRDADSLLTYRERQAVAYWEKGTKMAHSITDSISHTIPLMGGMIGFITGPFTNRMEVSKFEDLMALASGIDFNRKGGDQVFLNQFVLPKVHDSITEHFVLGHPQTFRGDCHNFIQDIDLTEHLGNLSADIYRETNGFGFHIGASGFQTDATVKWLREWGHNNEYWENLEKQFPEVFYWQL